MHDIKPDADATRARATGDGARAGRRRFIKGAAGAAPVLMTVASRPVWGSPNCTLSGQMSGNLSDQNALPCGGQGCPPAFWRLNTSAWSPAFRPKDVFNDVFGYTLNASYALLEVIDQQVPDDAVIANCIGGDKIAFKNYQNAVMQLASHAIAALQNGATQVSYDLTVVEVIHNFQLTYNGGDCDKDTVIALKDKLDILNNQGGPFC